LRAGGQIDEGAGLERGALDYGLLRKVLNHGSCRPIRPRCLAGEPDGYGMREVGWRGGGRRTVLTIKEDEQPQKEAVRLPSSGGLSRARSQ
jgi:hypothetical protein